MTSYNSDGSVGPWARDKLVILKKYLSAYVKVLKSQKWPEGIYYVDAFAGAGRAPLRQASNQDQIILNIGAEPLTETEQVEYIDGSPLVALNVTPSFDQYYFIEFDEERLANLEEIWRGDFSERNVTLYAGDANHVITTKILKEPVVRNRLWRGLMFIDPFGMQVPWSTLQAIAKTKTAEVIINFPLGTVIQRFLPKTGKIPSSHRQKLNEYFGSDEWEQVLYEEQPGLFGDEISKSEESGSRLVKWYQERLRKEFGNVSKALLIKNTKGSHLYYLIWAGPHPLGKKIVNDVLSKQGEVVS